MKKVYILLPVHNRKEVTQSFIKCLNAQSVKDFHLVLIDDGSMYYWWHNVIANKLAN
jgi:glycosyltransferase involved in cell wall biosynthesis